MSPFVIGMIAAILSVTSFVPQAWRIVKTRATDDLSAPMWILNTAAFAVWVAYGVALGEWPIMIPNSICFLLAGFILVMKLLPRPKRDAVADALDPAAHHGRAD